MSNQWEPIETLPHNGSEEDRVSEKRFWCVWREHHGFPPSMRHDSKESAVEEARRLAIKTNSRFYVLETIGIVFCVPPVKPITKFLEFLND